MMIDLSAVASTLALLIAGGALLAGIQQARYNRQQAQLTGEQATLQRIEVIHAARIADLQAEIVELKTLVAALEVNAKVANKRADIAERDLEKLQNSLQRSSGGGDGDG